MGAPCPSLHLPLCPFVVFSTLVLTPVQHSRAHPCSALSRSQLHHHPPCSNEEITAFQEFAKRPDVLAEIQRRVAPNIFGSEDIKKAVACLLFGGSRKVRSLLGLGGPVGWPGSGVDAAAESFASRAAASRPPKLSAAARLYTCFPCRTTRLPPCHSLTTPRLLPPSPADHARRHHPPWRRQRAAAG